MKKTTVVIDERLLRAAIQAAGVKSKRRAIEEGLKELIRKKNVEALCKEMGTFDLDIDLERLQKLREED